MSPDRAPTITITDKAHGLPFSKGLLAHVVHVDRAAPSKAYEIAQRSKTTCASASELEITTDRLREMAAEYLERLASPEVAARYLKMRDLTKLERAAHRPHRRHHRRRQVHHRHRGRAPARHHAHLLDRFHSRGHAWYIHPRPHARDLRKRVQRVAGSENPGA